MLSTSPPSDELPAFLERHTTSYLQNFANLRQFNPDNPQISRLLDNSKTGAQTDFLYSCILAYLPPSLDASTPLTADGVPALPHCSSEESGRLMESSAEPDPIIIAFCHNIRLFLGQLVAQIYRTHFQPESQQPYDWFKRPVTAFLTEKGVKSGNIHALWAIPGIWINALLQHMLDYALYSPTNASIPQKHKAYCALLIEFSITIYASILPPEPFETHDEWEVFFNRDIRSLERRATGYLAILPSLSPKSLLYQEAIGPVQRRLNNKEIAKWCELTDIPSPRPAVAAAAAGAESKRDDDRDSVLDTEPAEAVSAHESLIRRRLIARAMWLEKHTAALAHMDLINRDLKELLRTPLASKLTGISALINLVTHLTHTWPLIEACLYHLSHLDDLAVNTEAIAICNILKRWPADTLSQRSRLRQELRVRRCHIISARTELTPGLHLLTEIDSASQEADLLKAYALFCSILLAQPFTPRLDLAPYHERFIRLLAEMPNDLIRSDGSIDFQNKEKDLIALILLLCRHLAVEQQPIWLTIALRITYLSGLNSRRTDHAKWLHDIFLEIRLRHRALAARPATLPEIIAAGSYREPTDPALTAEEQECLRGSAEVPERLIKYCLPWQTNRPAWQNLQRRLSAQMAIAHGSRQTKALPLLEDTQISLCRFYVSWWDITFAKNALSCLQQSTIILATPDGAHIDAIPQSHTLLEITSLIISLLHPTLHDIDLSLLPSKNSEIIELNTILLKPGLPSHHHPIVVQLLTPEASACRVASAALSPTPERLRRKRGSFLLPPSGRGRADSDAASDAGSDYSEARVLSGSLLRIVDTSAAEAGAAV